MTPLRALMLLTFALALHCASTVAHADQYTVEPGQTWDILAEKLKPGDEVLLKPGKHKPAVFTKLEGALGTPIVIRCSDPKQLAQLVPDREGIKLVDCKHVRLQNLKIESARRAGVIVESTTRLASQSIAIHDVLIIGVKGLAEESGIIARDVRDLDIRRCRVENAVGSGVLIENCESVVMSVAQILSQADKPMRAGVTLAGRVWSTQLERVLIMGEIGTALSLGTTAVAAAVGPIDANARAAETNGSTPSDVAVALEPLVRFLAVSESRIARTTRFLDVGSCSDSTIRNCTISSCHEEIYAISQPPQGFAPAQITVSDCVFTWKPGELRRLSAVAEGAQATGFTLGANLWFSKELPLALELLGPKDAPFAGTVSAKQIMDIDPKLNDRLWVTAEAAALFGAPKQ